MNLNGRLIMAVARPGYWEDLDMTEDLRPTADFGQNEGGD
jgi:hypothetical protein